MKGFLCIALLFGLVATANAQRCNVSSAQASVSSAADVQNQALASVLAQLQAQNAANAARVATATAQAQRAVVAQSVAPLVIVPPQAATVTASSVGGASASAGRRHLFPLRKDSVAKTIVRPNGRTVSIASTR